MISLPKRLISIIPALILVGALILVTMLYISHEVPAAIVKGRSMLPLLREGDVVFITRCKPSEIGIGDIVIYRSRFEGRLVVHRVVDIKYINGVYYFVTKGDNNAIPDYNEFDYNIGVNQARIVGKVISVDNLVFKIPYVGYLALIIRRA